MEINYNSALALESFLKSRGLGMRKRYGQNFLVNPDTRLRLADALDARAGDAVWEIGPGLGAMTAILLNRKLQVQAFEIDTGFIGILHEFFDGETAFSLVEGDVLKTWPLQNPAPFLLGNLPYNIAAALIGGMIEKRRFFKCMVITVQKELALRMAAKPGTGDYSSFSVLCASMYRVKKLMSIHRSSFYPQPHVDSFGVKLELCSCPDRYPAVFYPLVRGLFASRRKIIKNNLADFLVNGFVHNGQVRKPPFINESVDDVCDYLLAQNKLSGRERAENLDIETFFRLAQTIDDMRILQ